MADEEITADEVDASEQEGVDSSALEAAVDNAVSAGFGDGGERNQGDDCPECKTGSPPWMATFADMATLLMAFFVLILSFSDTTLPRFEYINGSIQYAFGVKRLVPQIKIPAARSILMEEFTPNEGQPTVLSDPRQRELHPRAEPLLRRTQTEPERSLDDLEHTNIELADPIEYGPFSVTTASKQIILKISNHAATE